MSEREPPAAIPASYRTRFGTIDVAAGGYERGERIWFRYDGYRSNDATSISSAYDRVFAVDKTDVSPQYRGYEASRSTCWLGFTHTEGYHERRLAAKEGSR